MAILRQQVGLFDRRKAPKETLMCLRKLYNITMKIIIHVFNEVNTICQVLSFLS